MDKIKFLLPRNKWGTLKSKYKPESNYVTPDEFTSGSYNFITNTDGTIEKRPTSVQYNSSLLNGFGRDQFEAIFTSGTHHLLVMDGGVLKFSTGDTNFSVAQSGFTTTASMEYAMYQNRVYMDDSVDAPGVYDITASYGGVTYSIPQYKTMGAQMPVSAPGFAADSGTGLTGSFHYIITFLYYGFEESNGGPTSALHSVTNKTINLTGIPTGGYGVTARKIYRDANDGNFLLIATISDNTTTTFADSVSAGTTPIPTTNNLPPTFAYITLNLSRLWVAGVSGTPTTIYWSAPGLPDIFPPNNFIVCNPKDPIQAIYVYQGIVIVLNRHSVGQILGNTDNTFFYQEIPGSVGCVDNRSLQVRTIDGVPVLIWLSDRGFYSFNGSSIVYISDAIEDEVNLNIAQVNFVTNSNTQSTASDWAGGTSTPGIDLATNPGVIQTINPTKSFQSEADWESGTLTNIGTINNGNMIVVPTRFAPTLASGTLGGSAQSDGTNLTLPTISNFTGDNNFSSGHSGLHNVSKVAASFVLPFAGTITAANIIATNLTTIKIYSNSLGTPGVSLGVPGSLALAAGTYWVVAEGLANPNNDWDLGSRPLSGGVNNGMYFNPNDGFWTNVGGEIVGASVAVTQTPIASSGSWNSPVFDSQSTSAVSNFVVNTGSYPGGTTSATLFVDASNDSTMSTGLTTVSFSNPNGTNSFTTSNLRYWRIRYTISTTDNRNTPSVQVPSLSFLTTGTWVSPAILTTIDGTSFISMPIVANVPSGTSYVATIRTSADAVTWSAYSDISTAVINKYAQIKIVLTASSDDSSSASIVSVTLNWNLTSTFTSSIINLGQVPSGWGLFQDVVGTSGTASFSMRSASSSGGLAGATYFAVSNGTFPSSSILPLQYTNWQVVLTATPNSIPTVNSVTINWVIGNNQSPIRVASLFFNKTYYLAAAETGQSANNVVILYDFEGNWRLFRNVNINSLSLFFNQPFYCSAVARNVYQWLVPPNNTESITMDVRTKAFDLLNTNNLKNMRSFRVTGINTGTTIHAYFSTNRGSTWVEMLNPAGTLGYTTSTDGNKFNTYFVPDYSAANVQFAATTLMFRVTSTDSFPCKLMTMEPELYVRKGKYLSEAI